MRVLYLSHGGLTEPLNQAQILQYQLRLAAEHQILILSFERRKEELDPRYPEFEQRVREAGIRWFRLRYHKRPRVLATVYDLARALCCCIYLVLRYRPQVVHARSYVPSILALALQRWFGLGYIFDMWGFWADEQVDEAVWTTASPLYRLAKWFERQFLTHADVVVSFTRAAVDVMRQYPWLRARPPRFVDIPVCANLEVFTLRPRPPASAEADAPFTLGYVGYVGGARMFDNVLECLAILRELRPRARFVVLNYGQHDLIRQRLAAHGIPPAVVTIKSVPYHEDVAGEMNRMDAGVLFYRPTFAQIALAPTKLGEYLACGLPCLGNAGVGDSEALLEQERVGVIVRQFTRADQEQAVQRLLALASEPGIRERCAQAARRHFSLDDGVRAYDRIYRSFGA